MLHQRSVSDPPLSPSTLGPWEIPILDNRPTTPAPHNAYAYAKRPLPPLPNMTNPTAIPPPLNIKKRRNKPASLPVGPRAPLPPLPGSDVPPHIESRSASPRTAPSTPGRSTHLPRMSALPSPVAGIRQRTSKKVMQLMGHDVDVSNLIGAAPQEAKKEVVPRSSRSFDEPAAVNHSALLQLPEDAFLPVLEDDDGMDSLSSKKSSWGPGSPHSASAFPLGPQHSIRRRRSARIFDHEGSAQFAPQEDTSMDPDMDPDLDLDEDNLSDDMAEYHKFAVELASAKAKPSLEEANPPMAKGRRSSIMSFASGKSRLRRRPTTAEPHAARLGSSSSAETASQVQAAPAPEPEEPAVPKSAFESDSDSDDQPSRSIWRRDRSANKEDRGRDRGRDSPANMVRRDDESVRSRGWAKTGDQVKGLLAVGRKRREQQQAKSEVGVVSESVFA
ncbi:hypothetical protein TARUN_10100 [Trichoderma arundinaceum]|uniref:Uncharacterized protein n=1 Tax=Trichoderma arundinaceum TaxID=490622 RepID=A0A395N912_TRIAR|nr:hypothetical protein TARUN_10100 [Trichoderma arundinaceum]